MMLAMCIATILGIAACLFLVYHNVKNDKP